MERILLGWEYNCCIALIFSIACQFDGLYYNLYSHLLEYFFSFFGSMEYCYFLKGTVTCLSYLTQEFYSSHWNQDNL